MAQKINEDNMQELFEVNTDYPVSAQVINDAILPDGRLIQAGTSSTNNVIIFPNQV